MQADSIDTAYREMSRKRTIESQQKGRTIEVINDISQAKRLARTVEPLWVKQRKVTAKGLLICPA